MTSSTPRSSEQHPPSSLEVRVLQGTLQGARSRIDLSRAVRVSHDLSGDIVLPEAELEGCCIEFTASGAGSQLRVLAGKVQLGKQVLPPGEDTAWPLYTPCRLGRVLIAVGELESARWNELNTVGGSPATPAGTASNEAAAEPATRADGGADGTTRRPWSRWLLLGGGTVLAGSLSLLAFARTVAPQVTVGGTQAPQVQAELLAAGFNHLSVQDIPGHELVVTGYLDTSAQRARVELMLAQRNTSARVTVWVNEAIVSAVSDLFRLHGVAADARSEGDGIVTVSTRVADAAQLEPLQAAARRDIPGLVRLEVRNLPPPAAPDPIPVVDDPGKRVAAIVPGDPAHVVTVDGTRYFEGAMLPTGQVVAEIRDREVRLERGGTSTVLRF